jgi:hypothetical protein
MEVNYLCREEKQIIKRIVRIGQKAKIIKIFRLLCLVTLIEQTCLLRRQARLNIITGILRETEKKVKIVITTETSGTGKNPIVL